jgi:molybdopterin-guanine dinucleotide biosynthesis protein A
MGGVQKGLLDVGGRTILSRQIAVVAPLVDEVLLVAGDLAPYAAVEGVRGVTDRAPGLGPLAGIEAAFAACDASALLVFGCDLPFLDETLVRRLRDEVPGAQVLAPRRDGRPQPLAARYARSVVPAVVRRLERRALRLVELLDELEVAWLDGVEPRPLINLNTPSELAAARALVE